MKEFIIITRNPEDFKKTLGEKEMKILAESIDKKAILKFKIDDSLAKNTFHITDSKGKILAENVYYQ